MVYGSFVVSRGKYIPVGYTRLDAAQRLPCSPAITLWDATKDAGPARPACHSGVTSFSPTMPARMRATHPSRRKSALSLNSRMPTITVPIVPMPVQTA